MLSIVADDERTTPGGGGIPNPWGEFINQLQSMAERMSTPAAFGAAMPTPGNVALPRMLPPPGALSAAQLTTMSSTVAAQRSGIQALQDQLRAFDEQLAVLEQILGPLTEWSTKWADLERSVLPPGMRGDGPSGSSAPSP